jgi:nitrous oxidase accessory protein
MRVQAGWYGLVFGLGWMAVLTIPAEGGPFDLQARIRATPPGGTLRVPAGRYRGPIRLDRPIRLIGEGGPVLEAGGRGTVVWIQADDVTLEGFVLQGSGDSLTDEDAGIRVENARRVRIVGNRLVDVLFGIYLKNTHDSEVTANTVVGKDLPLGRRGDGIRLWWSHGNVLRANVVTHSRDVIAWFSRGNRFEENVVTDSRYGLHFMYSQDTDVRRNRFERNSTGIVVMYSERVRIVENDIARHDGPSAVGILLKDSDDLEVLRNRIVWNKAGIFWDNSPARTDAWNEIRENLLLWNVVAFVFQPNVRRNRIAHNFVVENLQSVEIPGGGTLTGNEWTWDGRGNFWSDYVGYDLQGDGIGDVPYRAEALLDQLTDRHPQLRLLAWTPAGLVLEGVSRLLPLFPVRPRIEDPRPWTELPAAMGSAFPQEGDGPVVWGLGSLTLVLLGTLGIGLLTKGTE